MKKNDFNPDLIISSPAERAKQTMNLVKDSAGFECEVRFDDRIYAASVNTLLYVLSEIEDEYESVMIFGHNPGFEGLVKVLCGDYEEMPTAALAVIDLKMQTWSDINADWGNLRDIYRPRDLM